MGHSWSGKKRRITGNILLGCGHKIYMLLPYKKAAQEDLTASQLKELRKLVKEVLK